MIWRLSCTTYISPCEVPHGDCATNDELLTGQDKLTDPDQSNEMDPPEMAGKAFQGVLHTGHVKAFVIDGDRVS